MARHIYLLIMLPLKSAQMKTSTFRKLFSGLFKIALRLFMLSKSEPLDGGL